MSQIYVNVYDKTQTKVMAAPISNTQGLLYVLEDAEATHKLSKPDYDIFMSREVAVAAATARKRGR